MIYSTEISQLDIVYKYGPVESVEEIDAYVCENLIPFQIQRLGKKIPSLEIKSSKTLKYLAHRG